MDYEEKSHRFQEYVQALEAERRKIQVFHRELPLSLQLLTQVIESYKQQIASESVMVGRSECEETFSDQGGPVLEEFIPLKATSSSYNNNNDDDDDDDDDQDGVNNNKREEEKNKEERRDDAGNKPDWLKSVQLWNQDAEPSTIKDSTRKLSTVLEGKKVSGAFQPFNGEKNVSKVQTTVASSTAEMGSRREEKEGQTQQRKARRCWSPELHRRFLNALQQLGGSHVATPKQIRELMKVDGLTNDEVKSHLQKYRLHTRRPTQALQTNSNSGTAQPPQFLVVGGIWVPPHDYPAVAQPPAEPTSIPMNGVYAPVATLPKTIPFLPHQEEGQRSPTGPLQWERRDSLNEDHAHLRSPTTSSSSHTSPTSPAL